jgi:amino acid adenylation domain-containing protein
MFQEGNKNKNLLLTSSLYIKQKEYWVNKLSGTPTNTKLLPDHIKRCRYPNQTTGNQREKVEIHISADLFFALMKLSKETDLSLYLILLTVLESLVYHYTGNEDIVLISPLYKMNITGDTLNRYLFIRQQDVGQFTFKELLLEIRRSIFESYENQDYPSDDLIDFLYNSGQIQDKDFSSNIECLLQNIHDYDDRDYEDIKARLVFSFLREDSQIRGHILYNPVIYDKFYLEQVSRHFVRILECAVENVNINIPGILFLSLEERQQLIHDFNKTETKYRKDKLVHERFEEQAVQTPDRIAAVYEHLQVSYDYLNKKSHQLAHLLQKKGVKPDTIVGIMVERTLEMLVGIWGVLQAGCAYLPIDPDYPGNRIKYMLEDSNAEILLSKGNESSKVSEKTEVIDLSSLILENDDAEPDRLTHLTHPTHLCYVIYTSGSTGMPKGVLIQHRNLLAYIEAFYREFAISLQDTVIQQTSYIFDASVEEVYPVLLKGGRLIIPNKDEIVDFDILLELITKHNVTIISCSPLLLNELNRMNIKIPIHTYISGSDVLKGEYIDSLLKAGKVYNTYGPTETTVCATYYKCPHTPGLNILIGKPISNYRVFILGKYDKLLPIGVTGELCVSGEGVSRGYLNRVELTAEKFIRIIINHTSLVISSFKRSESTIDRCPMAIDMLYRTGDLARWLADGNIEFLGRIDHQVKIRGYRIELEEIENKLLAHKEIKKAVVISNDEDFTRQGERQSQDRYICAYIVSDRELAVSELREFLSRDLPDYMIPSYFVSIEQIPLTPHGKIDRNALPVPELDTRGRYIAPRNEVEEELVKIWSEVLGIEKGIIGIDRNFFEIGGHSLNATIMAARVHKKMNVKLPLAEVFKTPTIVELAKYIQGRARDKFISIESAEEKEYYPLSSPQKGLYILQQMEFGNTTYNMPGYQLLEEGTDLEQLERAIVKLIKRHESLRASFYMINEEPVQRIHDEVEFKIEYYDLVTDKREEIQNSFIRSFDLSHVPLLRIGLVKTQKDQYLMLVDMHHIISDGISHEILVTDFMSLYRGKVLPPLRLQYKDFARWQNTPQELARLQRQQEYWLKLFEGEIPVLELPIDYAGRTVKNFAEDIVIFQIDGKPFAHMMRIATETGVTLHMFLLAIYTILLSKYSGQEDIVVGTPVSGRTHADLRDIIGMFVNMLVMRNRPKETKTFGEFLAEVKDTVIKAFDNQDYPFNELVANLKIQRVAGRHPLIDAVFSFHHTAGAPIKTKTSQPDVDDVDYKFDYKISHFDLLLHAVPHNDLIYLAFEYSARLFKKDFIEGMANHYKDILEQAAANPEILIKDFKISHQMTVVTSNILKEDQKGFNF